MKHMAKAAAPLLAIILLLAGCGGSGKDTPPQSYALGDSSLPSLNALVTLEDGVQFQQTQDEEAAAPTYVYSQLVSGGQTAQAYAKALEEDYSCLILADQDTGGTPDFSASSGQALAALEQEDSEDVLLLTIQWEDTSCSVTPSQTTKEALPQSQSDAITLEEAVDCLKRLPPSYLGLSGSSMDQYTVLPQEGTVLLDGKSCLCLNVYLTQTHQFQQSYLLTVPDLQVYRLDRATGQASPLG